jgi:integrase
MGSVVVPDGRTFGDIRLSRLNWQDIEHVYNTMRASGRSAAWVRRCATVLTRTLELARKRGLLDANPAKDAARPRSNRTKPFSPPAQELRHLLERAAKRDPELADAVTVLLSTGMRKGELLALRWVDVDLDLEEVHVAASVSDGGRGVGVVRRPTKTADWRDVPLTAAAAQALQPA